MLSLIQFYIISSHQDVATSLFCTFFGVFVNTFISGGTTSHELKPVASPLFLLHTPTVTWTSLAPQPVPAPLRCSNLPSSQPSAAPSPRMRPALSIWPGQGLLVFGGGPWQCLESTDSATEHDADAYLLRIDTASA